MSGNAVNHAIVRDIWNLAAEFDVQLSVSWHPRDTVNQAQADAWSKFVDSSQVMLLQSVFDEYIAQDALVQQLGGLTVDVFADSLTKRLPVFWAAHWSPGVKRLDAWTQDWGSVEEARGGLLYINPPWKDMGRVLQKVITDRARAVIVYPTWNKYWQGMWPLLQPRKLITLPARKDLLLAGPRTKQPGHVPASYRVLAAVITWD
jgi:hypothetical protein